MRPRKLSRLITACFAVYVLSAMSAQAAFISLEPNNSNESVNLAVLLEANQTDGVTVGDKTFSEFFYSTIGEDMPAPENVEVFGFEDASGNFGVSFHGVFQDLPGGGPSDALLRFTVEVSPDSAAQGYRISDAHLFAAGIGVGQNSSFIIDESFQQSNQIMSVHATTLGGPLETKIADWVFFDELYTKLRVTKDILAEAGGGSNLPARTTVIDQSFSQTQTIIPEPASLGLFVVGMLGLVLGKRRF